MKKLLEFLRRFIISPLAIALVLPFFWLFKLTTATVHHSKAIRDEEMGEPQEAIWNFATSVFYFPFFRKNTEDRIRRIYQLHGPFVFDVNFIAKVKNIRVDEIIHVSHSTWPSIKILISKIVAGDSVA